MVQSELSGRLLNGFRGNLMQIFIVLVNFASLQAFHLAASSSQNFRFLKYHPSNMSQKHPPLPSSTTLMVLLLVQCIPLDAEVVIIIMFPIAHSNEHTDLSNQDVSHGNIQVAVK